MTSQDHDIGFSVLSRLLPSDISRVSKLVRSNLSRGKLVSTVENYFLGFKEPSAADLSHIYKVVSQLNVADFWKYVEPNDFVRSLKGRASEEVLATIMETLGVKPDELKEEGIVSVTVHSVEMISPSVRVVGKESKPVRGTPKGSSRQRDVESPKAGTVTGTVKWFNTTKGFGFIAPEGGGKDVFVHISAVERAGLTTLSDNQKVTFEIKADKVSRLHLLPSDSKRH